MHIETDGVWGNGTMLSAACLLYVYSCNALSARFFAVDRANIL